MSIHCRVTGGELFHYLAARDRVSEDEAVEFLLQILEGVKHMHQKNIVHLDLKVRLVQKRQVLKDHWNAVMANAQ